MQFMSTATGPKHCCGSMGKAVTRLGAPQPNFGLILLLLSYLQSLSGLLSQPLPWLQPVPALRAVSSVSSWELPMPNVPVSILVDFSPNHPFGFNWSWSWFTPQLIFQCDGERSACHMNCSGWDPGTVTGSWEAVTEPMVKWHFQTVTAVFTHTWSHSWWQDNVPSWTIRLLLPWACQILMPKWQIKKGIWDRFYWFEGVVLKMY